MSAAGTTGAAKAALRERVRARRASLAPVDLVAAAQALRDVVVAAPEVARAACVAAYVSVGREPGTGPLLDALVAQRTRVLLPVVLPGGDLDWAAYVGPAGLRPAARGLLEPTGPLLGPDAVLDADVVLVPGLSADRRGGRLGRGGGSYDRVLGWLRNQPDPPWTCVLLHDGELLDLPVPTEAHDVPVAAAAMPSGLRRLRP